MTILASRDRYCIVKKVAKAANPSVECKKLVDLKSCRAYHRSHLLARAAPELWDIEDLTTKGSSLNACPFFASRNAALDADLVLCPYSYLMEPQVRSSLGIPLKGSCIIIDEAHNIEDAARNAVSLELSAGQMEAVCQELLELRTPLSGVDDPVRQLHFVLEGFTRYLRQAAIDADAVEYEKFASVWSTSDIVSQLSIAGMDCERLSLMQEALSKLTGGDSTALSGSTISILEHLTSVLSLVFSHSKHYRMAVQRFRALDSWQITMSFWCMWSKIGFAPIADEALSVVLASGTLSPASAFVTELGVPFPHVLETAHVVPLQNIWAGVISSGPTGSAIRVSYKHSSQLSLHDEIGTLLVNICRVVPAGVLVFAPSYSLLERLCARWQTTGTWAALSAIKQVCREPPGGGKRFDEELSRYRNAADNGAILLGVHRGKASEGVDFADHHARAVIIIGLPFPNIRELQVQLKKRYNDEHANTGILSGEQWYALQAFRAINQAAGRCVRSYRDFGAVLLVDDRFSSAVSQHQLSKWLQPCVRTFPRFGPAIAGLAKFFREPHDVSSLPVPQCEEVGIAKLPMQEPEQNVLLLDDILSSEEEHPQVLDGTPIDDDFSASHLRLKKARKTKRLKVLFA
eukprot:TRINITY_DN1534_c0_g1_i3.p1 TRINITY_DN1534_c0_g1~~TRINITY_DN1534_c0_g1_i3.p1  ORF type:complete len:631 (+),score=83.38 TRINITY_DN1534_c0_g1_i3:451-2343(+)